MLLWYAIWGYTKITCPFDPYAVYNKLPFSSLPPHFLMAAARKVDFTALCAAPSKQIKLRKEHWGNNMKRFEYLCLANDSSEEKWSTNIHFC